MDRAREVASTTLALRKAQTCGCASRCASSPWSPPSADELAAFTDVVADEVNVKSVRLLGLDDAEATSSVSRSGSR